jgi:hypothetical protein
MGEKFMMIVELMCILAGIAWFVCVIALALRTIL